MRNIFIFFMIFISIFSTPPLLASAQPQHEAVRGIYVRAQNTKGAPFQRLLSLVNQTELNAMVIDIKDDNGHLTFTPPKQSPYFAASRPYIQNPNGLIQTLEKHHIYPIARIVVFKDNVLAQRQPNWSFLTANGVWHNSGGDAFTNPFQKEVWAYNLGMAMEAVRLGFKEIQFDYVRFPEKFEKIEGSLRYTGKNAGVNRVDTVTGFVKFASDQLRPYGVKVSVDTFGNTTIIPEAIGIGQNFSKIAEHIDVISAMIYPSHWNGNFGITKPDLEPFRLVQEYAKRENSRLKKLSTPPTSRPWLQDFTATWLGRGNYKLYGKKEIEDQIRALHTQGINEYLLWNAANVYTTNVDYTPY